MKTLIIVIGFAILMHGTGCAMGYGRPQMTGMYGNPTLGMQMQASAELPIGTRGRVQPYGGSVYTGTGYTNPELVMAAHQARQRWSEDAQTTSVSVPLQSTTGAPQTVNQNLQARIEALEDQAAEDHLPQ